MLEHYTKRHQLIINDIQAYEVCNIILAIILAIGLFNVNIQFAISFAT